MKKLLIVTVIIVVALGLIVAFYGNPVEVKAIVPKVLWNRAGSGFELTNVPDAVEVKTPTQKDVWNRAGSGFELSSVRTPAEIKASIQKYMWNQAGSDFELSSMASDQK